MKVLYDIKHRLKNLLDGKMHENSISSLNVFMGDLKVKA